MANTYTKKYRLAYISTKRINDSHEIVINDVTKDNYGSYFASEDEFDTEEEALEHAANSPDWEYISNVVILPVYRKNFN